MKLADYQEVKNRLTAAQAIFDDASSPKDKLGALRTILKGAHPKIDAVLSQTEKEFSKLENLFNGNVATLSVELLPENTEEEKKRKKGLLLFLGFWNKLKSEIVRVQGEMEKQNAKNPNQSAGGKVFNVLTGSVSVVAVVAIGAALLLQAISVKVTIKNDGCDTVQVPAAFAVPVPGFSLPKEPIPDNSYAVGSVAPVPIHIDATQSGSMKITALGFTASYSLANRLDDVTWNGESLLGKKTAINLSDKKEHALTFVCN